MVDGSNGGIIFGNYIPINDSMGLPCRQDGMMWLTLGYHWEK